MIPDLVLSSIRCFSNSHLCFMGISCKLWTHVRHANPFHLGEREAVSHRLKGCFISSKIVFFWFDI